jgi:hypothetical protein
MFSTPSSVGWDNGRDIGLQRDHKGWDTATGGLISTIGDKKDDGVVAGWNATGEKVIINPLDKGDLQAVNPKTGAVLYEFAGSMPNGTIFSNDMKLLVTVPRKNKSILFQIWKPRRERCSLQFRGQRIRIRPFR